MDILIMLLACLVIGFQLKERFLLRQLKKEGFQSLESYHSQWLALSILWFVASAFFGMSYYRGLVSGLENRTQLIVALFYLLIAVVYVVRGFTRDILTVAYLWTSKGRIKWQDVRSYRLVDDKATDFVYMEVEAGDKTIVMKFLKKDRDQLESYVQSVYKKLNN